LGFCISCSANRLLAAVSFAKSPALFYDSLVMAVTRVQPAPSILSWQRLFLLFYWPWELLPLLAAFAWVYRQTMPPGMSSWMVEGWDSAVLQVTGSTWVFLIRPAILFTPFFLTCLSGWLGCWA
jgi:hypothetical protein